MVQPFHSSVDGSGETALVFIGDRFSHAVGKAGLLAADAGETDRLWEREITTPATATPGQLHVAEEIMAMVAARFGPTVYARIDLVDDEAGWPRVLEVELVEPSLFLTAANGAAQRLAVAVANRVTRPSRVSPL